MQVVAERHVEELAVPAGAGDRQPGDGGGGGSYVFSALNEDTSKRSTVWPTARSRR